VYEATTATDAADDRILILPIRKRPAEKNTTVSNDTGGRQPV
jgi:hypothetical protein